MAVGASWGIRIRFVNPVILRKETGMQFVPCFPQFGGDKDRTGADQVAVRRGDARRSFESLPLIDGAATTTA